MSENKIDIVKFFKPELKLVCEALLYRINHSCYDKLDDKRRREYEDILAKLASGVIVTEIKSAQ